MIYHNIITILLSYNIIYYIYLPHYLPQGLWALATSLGTSYIIHPGTSYIIHTGTRAGVGLAYRLHLRRSDLQRESAWHRHCEGAACV